METSKTTNRSPVSQRLSARKTALLALVIFVPLAAALLWYAFTYRVTLAIIWPSYGLRQMWLAFNFLDPLVEGRPPDGTLPVSVAILAAVFSAAGPAVLGAIIIANRKRMRAVLRPTVGKLVAAAVLTAIMPLLVVVWLPWIFGFLFWMMLETEVIRDFPSGLLDPDAWPWMLGLFAMFATCYAVSSYVISGVRSKPLRLAVFALLWWTVYFAILLAIGYQEFDI